MMTRTSVTSAFRYRAMPPATPANILSSPDRRSGRASGWPLTAADPATAVFVFMLQGCRPAVVSVDGDQPLRGQGDPPHRASSPGPATAVTASHNPLAHERSVNRSNAPPPLFAVLPGCNWMGSWGATGGAEIEVMAAEQAVTGLN